MKWSVLCIALIGLTVSCKKKGCTDPSALNYNKEAGTDDNSCTYDFYIKNATQIDEVRLNYANLAYAVYSDALLRSKALQSACQTLVNTPTESNLQLAKEAWLAVREIYGVSEIFRFAEGPIDNSDNGPEGLINAWPIDESYVDYVDGNSNSGIINDLVHYPTLNRSVLVEANENGGEENISVGFHAIEFLLWGQDFYVDGPGRRAYTDYVTGTGGTNNNQARRGEYLNLCCDLVVDALTQVVNEWNPSNGAYRKNWLAMDRTTVLRKMSNSIRVMTGTELSGERIYTAYTNKNQEDEHSCFSDNTHRDIILNSHGIDLLYSSSYTDLSGKAWKGAGLDKLFAVIDAEKTSSLLKARTTSIAALAAFYTPFDQAIVLEDKRPKVLEGVLDLREESVVLLEIVKQIGIQF